MVAGAYEHANLCCPPGAITIQIQNSLLSDWFPYMESGISLFEAA